MTSMKNIIKAILYTPNANGTWGLPAIFWGKPGIAKSAILTQVGKKLGFDVQVLIASLREPADFLGIPVPNNEGYMQYMPPKWAHEAAQKPNTIIFFDEFGDSPPSIQNALMRVTHERVVGEQSLHPENRLLAAGNPTDCSANGQELSLPLANRMLHFNWEAPTIHDWSMYIAGLTAEVTNDTTPDLDYEKEMTRVRKAWDSAFGQASSIVIGFLRAKSLLHQMPEQADPNASRGWPSHRTWEMVIRCLASAKIHGLTENETQIMLEACVGQGPATAFLQYRSKVDLPDPELVLDGKIKWKHDPKRLDRSFATLMACAIFVMQASTKKKNTRSKALWDLLFDVSKDALDITVYPALHLVQHHAYQQGNSAADLLEKLGDLFSAAGFSPKAA